MAGSRPRLPGGVARNREAKRERASAGNRSKGRGWAELVKLMGLHEMVGSLLVTMPLVILGTPLTRLQPQDQVRSFSTLAD